MTRRGLRSVVVGDLPDLGAFGAAFEEFMHAMTLAAVHGESEVAVSLRRHLGSDPKELPTTGLSSRWLSRPTCNSPWMRFWVTRRS